MRSDRLALACVLSALIFCGCASREQIHSPVDPQIASMLREVNSQRIESTVKKLESFGTRHTLSETDSDTRGIGAARRWIRQQLDDYAGQSDGRLKVEFQETHVEKISERIPRPVTIVNVLATLPGTSSEARPRVYVVSGHYDSRNLQANDATKDAPGANDDASGTAAVMEMARVMCRHQFNATIVFALVAGEEQGLNGSAALAEWARKENWNVAGMITNDIIGNTQGGNGVRDDSRVRVFSEGVPTTETAMQLQSRQAIGGENDGPSRQLARYIQQIGQAYLKDLSVTMVFRRDRFGRGGDHIPFLRAGFPAVRFTEPNEDFSRQHQDVTMRNGKQYGDVSEFVDFNYIAKVARLNLATIANLALAPPSPHGVTIDTAPSYDTKLSWASSDDSHVAGYAVLVRDTMAPQWQKRIDVGNVNNATISKINKDDVIFGVEAYDKQGRRSLPVTPLPRRPASAPSSAMSARESRRSPSM